MMIKKDLELVENEHSSLKQKEASMHLIEHTTRNKFLMLKNNMKLLLLLHFFPLLGFLFSLFYHKWLKFTLNQNNEIWVSLFNVYDVKTEQTYLIEYFRSFVCAKIMKNEENCDFLKSFRSAGVVSLLFLGFGILFHFYTIFQIILILIDKYIEFKPKLCLKLKKLQIITFFLYLSSFFIWFIGSACFNYNLGNLGVSFYINAGGVLFFFLLMLYFLYVRRKIVGINRISGLLFD